MPGRPAVFLDRDGCLTEETGYVNHVSRIRLLPRAAEAIRRLNQGGIPAVVVTNQAGIAKGYFSEEVLAAVNTEMLRQLAIGEARQDGEWGHRRGYWPVKPDHIALDVLEAVEWTLEQRGGAG